MAKAYKCDRCKRYFDERGKNYNEVVDGEYDGIALYDSDKFTSVRFDLCPDCLGKLAMFLDNEEIEE